MMSVCLVTPLALFSDVVHCPHVSVTAVNLFSIVFRGRDHFISSLTKSINYDICPSYQVNVIEDLSNYRPHTDTQSPVCFYVRALFI